MYKFVIVSVIALVVFHGALARPKVKQGAAPAQAETSQIDELAGQTRQIVKNVSEAIEGNLPDSKQVSETLTQSSQAFANKVKSVVDDLAKQAQEHKGDIEQFLNSVKDNLKTATAKLQSTIGPEATQKAKDIKANLDESVNKVISEAERLAKAAEPEVGKVQKDLNKVAKSLLDDIVDVTKNLQNELKKSLEPKN